MRYTHWTGPLLSADNWTNAEAVRGAAGIHACWPWTPEEMLHYCVDQRCCIAEVRGYGDTVQGTTGWRAQHCILQAVHCFPHQLCDVSCSPDGSLDGFYSEVPILCDQEMITHLLIDQLERDYVQARYRAQLKRLMTFIKRQQKHGVL